jgi:NAD(P)H-dependent FMN reductase
MVIEVISGSPRTESLSHRVAVFLQKALAEKTEHQVGLIDVRDNPLPMIQNVFVSVDKTPEQYKELAKRMFAAHAFVIITPEYNGGYSPAMKNLFDHFPKQHHKVFGIVTSSPGAMGGIRASQQVQLMIHGLLGIASPYMLIVPTIDKKFDAGGNLTDGSFQNQVDSFIHEFLWLADAIASKISDAAGSGS